MPTIPQQPAKAPLRASRQSGASGLPVTPASPPPTYDRTLDLQLSMFVPLKRIPKPVVAPVVIVASPTKMSRAEDRFGRLAGGKKRKATKASERTAATIEELVIDTGKLGWMKRMKAWGGDIGASRAVLVGVNVSKAWVSRDEAEHRQKHQAYSSFQNFAPASGPVASALTFEPAEGAVPALRAWPTIRKASRPKHTPLMAGTGPWKQRKASWASNLPFTEEQGDEAMVHPALRRRGPQGESWPHQKPKCEQRRPTITGAFSSPKVPASQVSQPPRARPTLPKLVTDNSIMMTNPGADLPRTPDSATLAKLHNRRTVREMIVQEMGFPLPPSGTPVPPVPPLPRGASFASSTGSGISSLIDGKSDDILHAEDRPDTLPASPHTPSTVVSLSLSSMSNFDEAYATTPEGNAFGSGSFWASRGMRTEPNLEELLRFEHATRKRSSSVHGTPHDSFFSKDITERRRAGTQFSTLDVTTTSTIPDERRALIEPLKRAETARSESKKSDSGSKKSSWDSNSLGRFSGFGPRRTLFWSKTTPDALGLEQSQKQMSEDLGTGESSPRSDLVRDSLGSETRKASLTSSQMRLSFISDVIDPQASIGSESSSPTDRPFSSVLFLEPVGVKPGKLSPEGENRHPFTSFDAIVPRDHAARDAFNQVREMLTSYWYSKAAATSSKSKFKRESKDATPDTSPLGASTTSLISLPGLSQRPRLRSKASKFKLFSRPEAAKSSDSLECIAPESMPTTPAEVTDRAHVPTLSRLPMPVMSKKGKEKMVDEPATTSPFTIPRTSTTALEISRIILKQFIHEFGTVDYPTLSSYITTKPDQHHVESQRFYIKEQILRKEYNIKNREALNNPRTWIFRKSPRDWVDPDHFNDPEEYDYETVLERQRRSLQMLQRCRRSSENLIPDAGLRIVWAMMFSEEEEKRYERGVREWEGKMKETVDMRDALGGKFDAGSGDRHDESHGMLPTPPAAQDDQEENPNTDGNSDYSDDDVRYAGILRDIEKSSAGQTVYYVGLSPRSNPATETEAEAKQRRRKTTFNMGWQVADAVDDIEEAAKRVSEIEIEKMGWEGELEKGLEKEERRQEEEKRREEEEWYVKMGLKGKSLGGEGDQDEG